MRPDPRHPVGGAGKAPAPPSPCPWASLALAGLAVVLHLVPGARELLAWERAGLAAGELWRVFSGHWVHWSDPHLLWDVATFAVLGAACERRARGHFLACVAGSALAISLWLWLWAQSARLDAYAGLSGIDSALFAWLAVDVARERWREGHLAAGALLATLFAAFALKVGFELATGAPLFVSQLGPGVQPVPAAHLVGAAVGVLVAAPIAQRRYSRRLGAARRRPVDQGTAPALPRRRDGHAHHRRAARERRPLRPLPRPAR